jgi:hypothetical protein
LCTLAPSSIRNLIRFNRRKLKVDFQLSSNKSHVDPRLQIRLSRLVGNHRCTINPHKCHFTFFIIVFAGDYLRLWRVGSHNGASLEVRLDNVNGKSSTLPYNDKSKAIQNRSSEYCAPLVCHLSYFSMNNGIHFIRLLRTGTKLMFHWLVPIL